MIRLSRYLVHDCRSDCYQADKVIGYLAIGGTTEGQRVLASTTGSLLRVIIIPTLVLMTMSHLELIKLTKHRGVKLLYLTHILCILPLPYCSLTAKASLLWFSGFVSVCCPGSTIHPLFWRSTGLSSPSMVRIDVCHIHAASIKDLWISFNFNLSQNNNLMEEVYRNTPTFEEG